MKARLITVLLLIAVTAAANAAHRRSVTSPALPLTPRSGMNGLPGTPASPLAARSIDITVTTFGDSVTVDRVAYQIPWSDPSWQIDNDVVDGKFPVYLWRIRVIGSTAFLCPAQTLQVSAAPNQTLHFQLDPAQFSDPWDALLVEGRSFYSITISAASQGGTSTFSMVGSPAVPLLPRGAWTGLPVYCN